MCSFGHTGMLSDPLLCLNTEPVCSDAYGYQGCPQTPPEMCRNVERGYLLWFQGRGL